MLYEDYHGHMKREFMLYGHKTVIVNAKNPLPDNPWVWRMEFFDAFPSVDIDLLNKGFSVAYYSVSNRFGCPEAIELMEHFREWFCDTEKMSKKPVLFGFSRGGLYACNYALTYPQFTGALYLDAPVLDFKSWPGYGRGYDRDWLDCIHSYNLTTEEGLKFRNTPLDRAAELAALKLPLLIVAGESDRVVPSKENLDPFEIAYKAAGGEMSVIRKPFCDHHPHSLSDPAPISAWILRVMGY